MDIIHLKYVAEVAKTGSITQAALNLGMNQPNLSKAIKALEYEMGFPIFKRSSKGVLLTKEGNAFLASANEILTKFEELETNHKSTGEVKRSLGISVPRASYISYAFTQFVNEVSGSKKIQFDYYETNSMQAIRNVSSQKHSLGIIRFALEYEKYYYKLLHDLYLEGEVLLDFEYLTVMSATNPLAQKNDIHLNDLEDMIEIINGDSSIPVFLTEEINRPAVGEPSAKTIFVYERGSQFDLLSLVPSTYMWVSPIPADILKRYNLREKKVNMPSNIYRDVLVQQRGYHMTATETTFLKHLYVQRDKTKE